MIEKRCERERDRRHRDKLRHARKMRAQRNTRTHTGREREREVWGRECLRQRGTERERKTKLGEKKGVQWMTSIERKGEISTCASCDGEKE